MNGHTCVSSKQQQKIILWFLSRLEIQWHNISSLLLFSSYETTKKCTEICKYFQLHIIIYLFTLTNIEVDKAQLQETHFNIIKSQ